MLYIRLKLGTVLAKTAQVTPLPSYGTRPRGDPMGSSIALFSFLLLHDNALYKCMKKEYDFLGRIFGQQLYDAHILGILPVW